MLRNLFEGCTPGACIEFGLNIVSITESPKVRVIFDIIQTASPAIPAGISTSVPLIPNANFTEQLIRYIGGTLIIQGSEKNKIRVQVTMDVFPGGSGDQRLILIEKPSQILEKQLENIRFSNEPTLNDLTQFISNLKGVRLVLHAPEKSAFAKHLTSSLTHWNTDISHIPISSTYISDGERLNLSPTPQRTMSSSSKVPSPVTEEDHIHSIPPAFILIDDDIMILENKLREFRDQPPIHRRSRKSKSRPSENVLFQGTTIAIIYFTSLSNYKRVRDTIQWFSTMPSPTYMPRVVVVPKPAGPRRFLTALHTAWINAVVEPHFIPIATSPLSPFVARTALTPSPGGQTDSSSGSFVTPGAFFTPHERLSPGRKMRLHSPNYVDVDRGNYFTPRNTSTNGNHNASITSPLGVVTNANEATTQRRARAHSNARKALIELTKTPSPQSENRITAPIIEDKSSGDQNKKEDGIKSKEDEIKQTAKPKMNFNISNRKRKEKNNSKSSAKMSPPITVLIVEGRTRKRRMIIYKKSFY